MTAKCEWCGGLHDTKCVLVKAIEYHPDGTTKRVEFLTPADYVAQRGEQTDPNKMVIT